MSTEDDITEAINSGDMTYAIWLMRRHFSDRLEKSQALLEGMTTEAKRHADTAAMYRDELGKAHGRTRRVGAVADQRGERVAELEAGLARAHAHHMFGVDVDGPPLDRVGALHYLRAHGLPEATPADLDAACEGLETPWGSGPSSLKCDACESVRRIYGDSPPGPEHAQVMCRDHDRHGRTRLTGDVDIDF